MPGLIRLVVDTNLFQECHKLDRADFPWNSIGNFDEIHLIVSEVVQGELDQQKKDTRPRVQRRAREAVSWFREMLEADQDEKVLRETTPKVILKLDVTVASKDYPDVLDQSIADDRLVGIAVALAKSDPSTDTRLLSHDTRPASKAKAVSLRFMFIPEKWIRTPEQDDQQKEIEKLRNEVKNLRSSSPFLSIKANNLVGPRIIVNRQAYAPLSDSEIRHLRDILENKFTVSVLEEISREKARQGDAFPALMFRGDLQQVSPTEKEKAHFATVKRPDWLAACVTYLQSAPEVMNGDLVPESISFDLTNTGGSAANNLRIWIRSKGNILIAPPPYEESDRKIIGVRIPKPPQAPLPYFIRDGQRMGNAYAMKPIAHPDLSSLLDLGKPTRDQRNPEKFYFTPNRPKSPVAEFGYEAQLFRHGLEPATFDVEVFPQVSVAELDGALEIQVSAANSPDVISTTTPVKISTNFKSAFAELSSLLLSQEYSP